MATTVWAFRPLPELKNALGFVECDDALAEKLLAAGFVQNPQIGATALTEIDHTTPPPAAAKAAPKAAREDDGAAYDDKEALPKRRR